MLDSGYLPINIQSLMKPSPFHKTVKKLIKETDNSNARD